LICILYFFLINLIFKIIIIKYLFKLIPNKLDTYTLHFFFHSVFVCVHFVLFLTFLLQNINKNKYRWGVDGEKYGQVTRGIRFYILDMLYTIDHHSSMKLKIYDEKKTHTHTNLLTRLFFIYPNQNVRMCVCVFKLWVYIFSKRRGVNVNVRKRD
jgi:hypothetical protein